MRSCAADLPPRGGDVRLARRAPHFFSGHENSINRTAQHSDRRLSLKGPLWHDHRAATARRSVPSCLPACLSLVRFAFFGGFDVDLFSQRSRGMITAAVSLQLRGEQLRGGTPPATLCDGGSSAAQSVIEEGAIRAGRPEWCRRWLRKASAVGSAALRALKSGRRRDPLLDRRFRSEPHRRSSTFPS